MIATLITRYYMNSVSLPEQITGRFWLDVVDNSDSKNRIAVEAIEDAWCLKTDKKLHVINNDGTSISCPQIQENSILYIAEEEEVSSYVFVENDSNDRKIFSKYHVAPNVDITIGRNPSNEICFNNQFVSSDHAVLHFDGTQWSVQDYDSSNGTFVNGQRVYKKKLNIGDLIYIMGLKIVIGGNFIAINNPDGQVCLLDRVLEKMEIPEEESITDFEDLEFEDELYFYRSPRFKREIDDKVFEIDAPPQKENMDEMPIMIAIGPSVTMGMASIATAIYAVVSSINSGNIGAAIPSIIMAVSMLLGTALWPVISRRFEKKRKEKKEVNRQEKYNAYLDQLEKDIYAECKLEEEILNENNETVKDHIVRIKNVKRNLWEREFGQTDFLNLRVGHGDMPMKAKISKPNQGFTLDEDSLVKRLHQICDQPYVLHNVPIVCSLYEDYIAGVVGNNGHTLEFVKGLIFQIAALYSYDEVKMVFLYDEDEVKFGFVKWLPHVWNEDKSFRFVATNKSQLKEVTAYLQNEIEKRKEIKNNKIDGVLPYYVIFSLSKNLAARSELLNTIYNQKSNLNISVVSICENISELHKECSMVIELEGDKGKIFDKNEISGKAIDFTADIYVFDDCTDLSIRLANINLDSASGVFDMPSVMPFLDMFDVSNVEHLNVLTRWKESNPDKTLETPIGVDTYGELFKLDLHEKFHGPHGLVAGMTGSGKSEFIMTYILSLAINYHPDEVAFILIDYKGGGMAKSFANLPHVAGIITNLDGAAIKRSLVSIESELTRRQAIFAETSKQIGVSNIDIYKYQKLYREGTVSEPLQHLFIISDEFAELKAQQPEFMEQLVSTARIGRSLGVHLILATQKPSGVVNDQIWSNSKFKACLKVQDKADSMEMLKRSEAAELKNTGRFYLQVGYNELFEMGQSAWAGADYSPELEFEQSDNKVISVVDMNGHQIAKGQLKNSVTSGRKLKQLDAITNYISKVAENEGINVRPMWLNPLPPTILFDSLKEKYKSVKKTDFELNPIIGEYDDPKHQSQNLLALNLSNDGNVAIYGSAGSGKTTLLSTLLYSLITEHTAEELNIYTLDFASGTLKCFDKAPQVGDVVLSYEKDKVVNLLKMLTSELESRKKLFADYGGEYKAYVSSSKDKVSTIVTIINNYAVFQELYEDYEIQLISLLREGKKYGLFFVVTALSVTDLRFRMSQNFKRFITLQMNDEGDYSDALGRTGGVYPAPYKGRGLIKEEEIFEFQTAVITSDGVSLDFIQKECSRLNSEWKRNGAKAIPVLPEKVDLEFLARYVTENKTKVPIGVEKGSLEICYQNIVPNRINIVAYSTGEYMSFVENMALLMGRYMGYKVLVSDLTAALDINDEENVLCFYSQKDIEKLLEVVETNRNNNTLLIINSLASLKGLDNYAEFETLLLSPVDWLTIVLVENDKQLSTMSFDSWYRNRFMQTEGIWIGNGINNQYQLQIAKQTAEMRGELNNDFGFSIQAGNATLVKLLGETEAIM